MGLTSEALANLEQRVGDGTAWLAEHDPGSRFHAWWQAGLTPLSPLPAQEATPEVREQWLDYFKNRQLWERLERQLAAEEQRARNKPPTVLRWVGENGPVNT